MLWKPKHDLLYSKDMLPLTRGYLVKDYQPNNYSTMEVFTHTKDGWVIDNVQHQPVYSRFRQRWSEVIYRRSAGASQEVAFTGRIVIPENMADLPVCDCVDDFIRDYIHMEELNWQPKDVKHILDRIQEICQYLPWKVRVVNLARRFIYYVSDGSFETQREYIGATYHELEANRLPPLDVSNHDIDFSDEVSPCLYYGPAWMVRLELKKPSGYYKNPCPGNRLWLADDGMLIQTDWCQRDSLWMYRKEGGGIDLAQPGRWTLDEWLMGPLWQNAEGDDFGIVSPREYKEGAA